MSDMRWVEEGWPLEDRKPRFKKRQLPRRVRVYDLGSLHREWDTHRKFFVTDIGKVPAGTRRLAEEISFPEWEWVPYELLQRALRRGGKELPGALPAWDIERVLFVRTCKMLHESPRLLTDILDTAKSVKEFEMLMTLSHIR